MSFDLVLLWGLFAVLIFVCLAVDLGLGKSRQGKMSVRAAAVWSCVWIALAMAFAGVVAIYPPKGAGGVPVDGFHLAQLFVTGYLLEKALSVDNMFVFIMVFAYFAVKDEDQPRVLKWGILGALFFRGVLISMAALLAQMEWVLYLFALLLVWAAYKMLTAGDEEIHPEKNPVLLFVKRFFPIVNRYEGHKFFTLEDGRRVGTALLVVLIVIESTDVVFALDSIPAIFGVTFPEVQRGLLSQQNQFFIVFTSNVFAILGLRALFFVLAGIMDMFHHLKTGVAVILFFIAGKMLAHRWVHISATHSLAILAGILAVSIVASILTKPPPKDGAEKGGGGEGGAKKAEAGAGEVAAAPAGSEEKS